MRRTSSTMPLTPPYVACPARRCSSSWETSMPGWARIGKPGLQSSASWDREDEREWPKTSRAVLLPQSCNHEHLLRAQRPTQSVMVNTKMQVYKACVLSTLLYSSESWTSYAAQERRLNTFHLHCLRRILGIKWQDRIPTTDVLEQAGLPTIFTLLSQRRLRWLGHIRRMKDGRIPKDLLYGELSEGSRPCGRPRLCFKDTCQRDLKSARIEAQSWEDLAESRDRWRAAVHSGTAQAEQARIDQQSCP